MRKALGAAVLCAVMGVPASAQAADTFNSKPYRQKVTVANMLVHERALQRIADANGRHPRGGDAGQRGNGRLRLRPMKARRAGR